MQNNISVLPLWTMDKRFYATFSIINFILLILQFGLPISLFFFFTITSTLFILLIAFLISIALTMIFQVISKENPMLNYYLGIISSLIFVFFVISTVN